MSYRWKSGAWVVAVLGLLHGTWAGAQSGPVAPGQAPAAWIAYAERVSQQFQSTLAGESEPAQRFRDYVGRVADARSATSDAARDGAASGDRSAPVDLPGFRVKVWFDNSGVVTRIETNDVEDAQAFGDLRAALLGRHVGARPPRGMKQPLIVRLATGAGL